MKEFLKILLTYFLICYFLSGVSAIICRLLAGDAGWFDYWKGSAYAFAVMWIFATVVEYVLTSNKKSIRIVDRRYGIRQKMMIEELQVKDFQELMSDISENESPGKAFELIAKLRAGTAGLTTELFAEHEKEKASVISGNESCKVSDRDDS